MFVMLKLFSIQTCNPMAVRGPSARETLLVAGTDGM